jgi:hypothetical protein
MKNKVRIQILETEISRLKVANRTANERLTLIEGKLGIEVPRPARSAVLDAMLNKFIAKAEQRKSESNHSEIPNTCEPIKPDFIPDWKNAPEDAVCVAMDKDGDWYWYRRIPPAKTNIFSADGSIGTAGKATNAHLLPPDYWKSTLMMRPEASEPNQAHKNVLVNFRSFEPEYTSEPSGIISVPFGLTDSEEKSFIEMKMKAMHDEFEIKRKEIIEKFKQPDALSAPDYSHLLPDGYEFCQESDAEKWVKVKSLHSKAELPIGYIEPSVIREVKPYYRPIRPTQYKVTTHEIVTAVPDPYMPDWSKAPEGTVAHAWDEDGTGFWCTSIAGSKKWESGYISSPFTLPADLDWKQSLRVKPSK